MDFDTYNTEAYYDELFEFDGRPRKSAAPVVSRISSSRSGDLQRRQKAAEAALMQMGITFGVYDGEEGTDRIFPFDMLPRTVLSYARVYRTETTRSSRVRSQTCNGHGRGQR
jgi:uncharacterized circularly permuted ATP-grasp superfamily protein